jgi:hypothetical protein
MFNPPHHGAPAPACPVGPTRNGGPFAFVDFVEPVIVQAVNATLCFGAHRHDVRVAQHFQVLGDRGAAHLEQFSNLPEGALAHAE